MKKYNKATKQTIRDCKRRGFLDALKGAGYTLLGFLPSIVMAGAIGAGTASIVKGVQYKNDGEEILSNIVYDITNSEDYQAVRQSDMEFLQSNFEQGKISNMEYMKSLEYINSDDYFPDYLRTYNQDLFKKYEEAIDKKDFGGRLLTGGILGETLLTIGMGTIQLGTFAGGGFKEFKEDVKDCFDNVREEFREAKRLKKKEEDDDSSDDEMGM